MDSDYFELWNLRTELKEEREMKGAQEAKKSDSVGFLVLSCPTFSEEPNFIN